MSAQVLPYETKQIIEEHINNYDFGEYSSKVPFYVSHMLEKDLWKTQGSVFMNYLDDLDAARKVNWNYSFKEMELEKHDPRVN